LHTKIDEHEIEVQILNIQHDTAINKLKEEKSNSLKQIEDGKCFISKLQTQVVAVEKEKEKLTEEHNKYMNDVEEQFKVLKEKYEEQQKKSSDSMSVLKICLTEAEKKYHELLKKNDMIVEQLKNAEQKNSKEIDTFEKKHRDTVSRYEENIQRLKKNHQQQLKELKEVLESELSLAKEKLSSNHKSILEKEVDKHRVECTDIIEKCKETENTLNHRISVLSNELCVVRDKLALAEEKNRLSERQLWEKQKYEDTKLDEMKKKDDKLNELQQEVTLLKGKVFTNSQKYSNETHNLRVQIDELQDIRTSNELGINDLQMKCLKLSEKCQLLENEKKDSDKHLENASNVINQKLKMTEKELENQMKEKRELRAQFAREIESVRSQMSENESTKMQEHLRIIKQLNERHEEEINFIMKKHKKELDSFKNELEKRKSTDLANMSKEYKDQIEKLSDALSEKTTHVNQLQEKFEVLSSQYLDKQKLSESVRQCMDQLQKEVTSLKLQLSIAEADKTSFKAENLQLKSSLNELMSQMSTITSNHKNELKNTEERAKQVTENRWKEILKNELKYLRQELQEQHNEIHTAAMNKLINIKDSELKDAEENWLEEKRSLTRKVLIIKI
jgi:chromosome segregation ATPase